MLKLKSLEKTTGNALLCHRNIDKISVSDIATAFQ